MQRQSATPPGPASAADRGVVLFERREFERAVAARIVPAQQWSSLERVDALLERLNALYAEAEAEIEQARQQGQSAGFAEGLARAQQQMTEKLAGLNERRARVLAEATGRITDLACAIVARLAPGFDAAAVVPPLVMQAVEAAQAEQFLLIRVHPSVRASVESGLGAVRQAHPAVGVIELVDDESLDPLSCVVVSEAGEVRAGVAQQIEAIRTALAGAGAGAGAGGEAGRK
ncbi:FliH/SctL family protein [Luteimonas sp. RD2P54]|uniref:FliH/SctL family protein n=1 Tax=Luteimonas endophytica TaxID=3042023 RepID=A0ABT6J5D3_9GAMM|nr:FliH/SctL family protein [Luteimonas endophytica]MDH5822025.1 FliH/SctL family protein [Luteimonas endophytica]